MMTEEQKAEILKLIECYQENPGPLLARDIEVFIYKNCPGGWCVAFNGECYRLDSDGDLCISRLINLEE